MKGSLRLVFIPPPGWLDRAAGNPRSLDVTGAGAGQKTKPGMSRIALPKKSYLVSREQYIALLIRESQSSLLSVYASIHNTGGPLSLSFFLVELKVGVVLFSPTLRRI